MVLIYQSALCGIQGYSVPVLVCWVEFVCRAGHIRRAKDRAEDKLKHEQRRGCRREYVSVDEDTRAHDSEGMEWGRPLAPTGYGPCVGSTSTCDLTSSPH